jgi:hypothetical protein
MNGIAVAILLQHEQAGAFVKLRIVLDNDRAVDAPFDLFGSYIILGYAVIGMLGNQTFGVSYKGLDLPK